MLTAGQLLEEGEVLIGDYNVEIARWRDGNWTPTIPPLYVVLTDHRMILQPHARKRLDPAIIPARYIKEVRELDTDNRHGIMLHLKTGHQISMFVSGDPNRGMLRGLRAMMTPPSPVRFEPQLDLGGLQKLIDYFSAM